MSDWPASVRNSPIFQDLGKRQIQQILKRFEARNFRKGATLISPRARKQYFYIVQYGAFRVLARDHLDGEEWLVSVAGPGDILGEVALLTGKPHSTRVVASLDSRVLRLEAGQMRKVLGRYPRLTQNLGQLEAERLRRYIVQGPEKKIQNKIIVHIGWYDFPDSVLMGLNLAGAFSRAYGRESLPFLPFLKKPLPPNLTGNLGLEVVHINTPKKTGKLSGDFYRREPLSNWLKATAEGVALPLVPPGPYDFFKAIRRDAIPAILSQLLRKFPVVLAELDPSLIRTSRGLALLRQADQLVLGVCRESGLVEQWREDLDYIKKKVPHLESGFHFYYNGIRLRRFARKERTRDKTGLELPWHFIEKKYQMNFDFLVRGPIAHPDRLQPPGLIVHGDSPGKVGRGLRSMGRWLAGATRGLALGGGGARGLASVGVLRAFEDANISFDAVAGTSMGALVGALYASGYESREMEEMFRRYLGTDKKILDYGLPFVSFFRGQHVNTLLKKVFGRRRIEDLEVPFSCVAVDLLSGQEICFQSGLIWRALRASMSLPVVFPPVKYRQYYLVDGGVTNNIPGDILKKEKVNLVIGVNCTPEQDDRLTRYLDETQLLTLLNPGRNRWANILSFLKRLVILFRRPPILEVANRALGIEGREIMRSKSHYFDYMLAPELRDFGLFDFSRQGEIIAAGYERAREEMQQIRPVLGLSD